VKREKSLGFDGGGNERIIDFWGWDYFGDLSPFGGLGALN
jgi:hypothetical protein